MKKMETRAIICLTLVAVLVAGMLLFVFRFVSDGGKWATFYGNQTLYTDGHLNRGAIYDRNDQVLIKNTSDDVIYNEDPSVRKGTLHVVGDLDGNIGTGALSVFRDKIIGYNLLTGTYSWKKDAGDIKLTIDGLTSKVAYEAMAGRKGLVGVYNYKTGEILTMVSTPTYDPLYPGDIKNDPPSGLYLNKVLSAKMTPGSIFKLVTSAAAIENLSDVENFSYDCDGEYIVGGEKIRCPYAHGHVNFETALAKSCNGAFAKLSEKLGPTIMTDYVKKLDLEKEFNINGVHNIRGSFQFPKDNPLELGWAGIGQYKDLINPMSMLVYMGAIAGDGKAVEPVLLKSAISFTSYTDQLIQPETAKKLQAMMKNNVEMTYGEHNFPDLDIYAKSGTAEVGNGSNGWFAGFIKNPDAPYAFIVCVEGGADGARTAGPVANKVLQQLVNSN